MMRELLIMAGIILLIACGASRKAGNAGGTMTQENADRQVSVTKEDHERGLNLVAHSDCLTCHSIDQDLVGPKYSEIAKRYAPTAGNINKLAAKVISGGSGNWKKIPMIPHPDLKTEDAQMMVKYILSVNTHYKQ